MSTQIRPENGDDKAAVFVVNTAAFPTDAEARLVDALRESAMPYVSLVVVQGDELLGHIMFTPVTLAPVDDLNIMGLAPMAVLPERQNGGIGTALVEAGLHRCRALGVGAVAVLGHPDYYPRFGFTPSANWRIKSEYDVPEEAFMIMELSPGHLERRHGTISYHPAFAGV